MTHMPLMECGPTAYNKIGLGKSNSPRETALDKHDRYLITLDKQKKLLKTINPKNKEDEELEKREKAFSPYVNGANAPKSAQGKRNKSRRGQSQSRTSKSYSMDESGRPPFTPRITTPRPKSASTVPQKSTSLSNRQRKFWGQGSVQIKDETGNTLRAARDNLQYSYTDDFDEYDSSDSETDIDSFDSSFNRSDNDFEDETIPEDITTRKCWNDNPRVSSSEIIREEIISVADSLSDVGYSDLPVLGEPNSKS